MPTQKPELSISAQKKLRDHHLEAVKKLAKQIPRLRWWILTDADWMGLAAHHERIANAETDPAHTLAERFIADVQRFESVVPKLFREDVKPPALPTRRPTDVVTGQPILQLPDSMTERALMSKHFPEWYAVLEKNDKSPIKMIVDQAEAQAKYEQAKSFWDTFDPEKENPFVSHNLEGQREIAKSDPVTAEFLKAEATPCAALPCNADPNQTVLSRLAQIDTDTSARALEASKLAKSWSTLDQRAEEEDAARHIAALRKMGLEISDPRMGRRERKPMKTAPMGSKEQERKQHEAARIAALNKIGVTATEKVTTIE